MLTLGFAACLDLAPDSYAFSPVLAPADAGRPFTREDARARVSATFDHLCVVLPDASVSCWGYNESGQVDPDLGNSGWVGPRAGPSMAASAVAAGNEHTCAISSTHVSCWGSNREKQLGSRDRSLVRNARFAFELDPSAPALEVLASRESTCVRDAKRQLLCWGNTQYFSMNPAYATTHVPTTVAFGADRAATGEYATCWLSDGGADCTHGFFRRNFAMPDLSAPVSDVTIGDDEGICLVSDGGLLCEQYYGKACTLGARPEGDAGWYAPTVPARIVTGAFGPLLGPSFSTDYSCWVDEAGRLWCFGTPPLSAPDGVTWPSCTPVLVMEDVLHVVAGSSFACVVTRNAELWCFGDARVIPPFVARAEPQPPTFVMRLGGP